MTLFLDCSLKSFEKVLSRFHRGLPSAISVLYEQRVKEKKRDLIGAGCERFRDRSSSRRANTKSRYGEWVLASEERNSAAKAQRRCMGSGERCRRNVIPTASIINTFQYAFPPSGRTAEL